LLYLYASLRSISGSGSSLSSTLGPLPGPPTRSGCDYYHSLVGIIYSVSHFPFPIFLLPATRKWQLWWQQQAVPATLSWIMAKTPGAGLHRAYLPQVFLH